MTIEEFVQEAKKRNVGVKVDGSQITLHETYPKLTSVYLHKFETKIIFKEEFLLCNALSDHFEINKNYTNLEKLKIDDLTAILECVKKVTDTPVDERFSEPVYWLSWLGPDSMPGTEWLKLKDSGFWQIVETQQEATIFTQTELEKLKNDTPHLAPAIDAMKTEVVTL